MTARRPEHPAEERLLRLLGGKWIAAALAAAAELGVADALEAGPRNTHDLAAALGCDEAALGRLLRALASEGILDADADRFELTELGRQLRSDALGPLARYVGSPAQWAPWSGLAGAVRTGRSAFAASHGQDLFEYLDHAPDDALLYHTAVDAFTRHQARVLAQTFDFASFRHVVDVGGGFGTLVVEVLRHWPHLDGTLYDRPSVVQRAPIGDAHHPDIAKRVRSVGGDFLEWVPEGADVYVVKHVLHNWGDEDASRILRACAAAAGPKGRVLVIEGIVLPGNRQDATRLLDLEMLALCRGGYERSKPQFRALFAASGLKLVSAEPLAGGARLLVGVPRPADAPRAARTR